MAEGPDSKLYVRPVRGHLVPRYGTPDYLGATFATAAQRAEGAGVFVWDTDSVVVLHEDYVRRYRKELLQDIANGALVEVSADYFAAHEAAQQAQQEAIRVERERLLQVEREAAVQASLTEASISEGNTTATTLKGNRR